ncbi:MAG: multidrug ABC transporter substrate-binding protein [Deltaproteobacteria bacterium CG_4_8_14_3_um_filter_45_9]|nr:MAG: multidrug ABC transporter substrate-binding protein [Deltaproteobacteria bacterium CG_4_8_14_3_um_filter_45_9]
MTRLFAGLRLALRALLVNKMRSALTMLGIIIGVSAVIAMIAVGSGAKARIAEQIASMGSNLIIVLSGSSTSGGLRYGSGTVPTLTAEDAKAIQTEIPSVKYVAPNLTGIAQVIFGNQNWSTVINGTTPEVLEIRDWPLASGRPFTQQDIDGATKVCLLGKTVADNLFGGIDPIGQVVRIKKVPFTVIGVLASKGQSTHGTDQDDTIIVPLTTAQKRLFGMQFPGMVRMMLVQARGPEVMQEVENQINDLLRQRHRIQPNQENDFTVRNLTEVMSSAEQSAGVMSLLLGAIASISLIVGGIGIMNIMLVSVTERTREIGIRIAVGAKGRDILLQFLIESLVLSLIGGTVGIGIGVVGTLILSSFTQWPTLFSMKAILLAFLFSGSVGVFFGFYPARKASMLNPIEALRYE